MSFYQERKQVEKNYNGWCDDIFNKMVDICFTQIMASKVIRTYGERVVTAMLKEYKQLNDLKVFVPENPANLMDKQKRDALCAINLI